MPPLILLIMIGLAAGISAGLFGIGGGIIVVPALVYLAGFSQHQAVGTSLAILLPPVGLGAVIAYYRHGAVDIRAALIVATALFIGAILGAIIANHLTETHLKLAFGVFMILMGLYVLGSTLANPAG